MFPRNRSAESPQLSRGVRRRRSSVVDWVNGLTDNNQKTTAWTTSTDSAERITKFGSVTSVEEPAPDEQLQHKCRLIQKLKTEVKIIMEEAVTKKRLDIDSAYVTSLCGAVECCIKDGLRGRLLGLFGSRSSFALLHTASRHCAHAQEVLLRVQERDDLDLRCHNSGHLAWIREALHMRKLHDIVEYISSASHMRRLYDPSALMLDRAKSGMVAALLLGPCAATFSRMSRTTADCLEEGGLERSARQPPSPLPSRPPLTIQRQGSSIMSSERGSTSKDYVYSLHHNFKSSLLYGKNNVSLASTDGQAPVKGYLSLHKSYEGNLSLKWTPNQLMHASSQPCSATAGRETESQWLWRQAIHIDMADIIYIHLHQRDESSPAVLSLVDCEGVQSAPLQLPHGQHSLVFLCSLETGLSPALRLEPPLWIGAGKEKMLPRLRKRSTALAPSALMDLVFRIVRANSIEQAPISPPPLEHHHEQCVSLPNSPYVTENVESLVNLQIDKACQSVKHQIMARAFFGWLSYCRHLRTVRQHLQYLVEGRSVEGEGRPAVDESFWRECREKRTPELEDEFLLRVYWSGIEGTNAKQLRRQAWPYLLGLFAWADAPEPKTSQFTSKYRDDVEEWRILEAEVRRRDEQAFIAARQQKKCPPERDSSMLSDVFDDEAPPTQQPSIDTPPEGEELLNQFATNLHRIDKDVERCDRNLIFFSNKENLESLRRVMCTYVRRNLDEGYIQGMCDLVAPLLVVFEDEALTLECFTILMKRLRDNFPQRHGMDKCLSGLRSLIQVVDPQIFSILSSTADFTYLYFSYRWFLLDFKRELSYDSTYRVWETIWACSRTFSPHFALFFALAMVTNYRDVILTNNMDFTDMIKFFNEMAERHDSNRLLQAARGHVKTLQGIVKQLK